MEVRGDEVYGPEVRWQGNWPFDAYSGRRLAREELLQAPGQRLTLAGWALATLASSLSGSDKKAAIDVAKQINDAGRRKAVLGGLNAE